MPPPPPPPRASIGNSSSSGGGGYYNSNAGQSSSTATRNRLGLNKNSRTSTTANNSSNNQGSGMSSDWFASNNNNSTAPPAPAPSSGSGFYSSTAPSNDMYSNNYGANNSYGNNNNNTISSGGSSISTGYYGGTSTTTAASSGYGQTTAMSGAIGSSSTNIPPPSAFGGSNPNSGSFETMNTNNRNSGSTTNSYEMGGPIGGPIGGSSQQQISTAAPNVFDPNAAAAATKKDNNNIPAPQYEEDYDNEPPLLEELGVNFPHIYSKSRAVLFPFGKHAKSLESGLIENDADLAGPLAFALGLGGELLLSGKMHFGYVYGFGMSGCLAMTLLLNLLNPNGAVSVWTVVSILGYALLPVNLLAGMNVLLRVHKLGVWGMVMAVLTIVWCTTASARLFERGCNMRAQRFLVAYPTALLYSAFVMITIF